MSLTVHNKNPQNQNVSTQTKILKRLMNIKQNIISQMRNCNKMASHFFSTNLMFLKM